MYVQPQTSHSLRGTYGAPGIIAGRFCNSSPTQWLAVTLADQPVTLTEEAITGCCCRSKRRVCRRPVEIAAAGA